MFNVHDEDHRYDGTAADPLERAEDDQLRANQSLVNRTDYDTARNVATWIIVFDRAQARENTKKTMRDEIKTTLRPKTSDQRPYIGVNARLQKSVGEDAGQEHITDV